MFGICYISPEVQKKIDAANEFNRKFLERCKAIEEEKRMQSLTARQKH